MKISRCVRIGVIAVLATLALSGTGWAFVVATQAGPFDFFPCSTHPDEYDTNFVEVRRAPEIGSGLDLGGTGHCAVNFTGLTGSAGDTWLTRYNDAGIDNVFNAFNSICMRADVLISKFNNAKGGGLVALLNTDPGDKGLFLLLINNGNTDRLTLNTIDPNDGRIVQLASAPLGSAIVENAWYRVEMEVFARTNVDSLTAHARVRSHTDPSNPSDATVDGLIGTLSVGAGGVPASLSGLGLEQSGFVGMAAWAKSAVVNTSITNFFALAPCVN
jgi:hypothetical protein